MELYLQFGHGMMAHTKELIENWRGGGVILSPRDLDEKQLRSVATEIMSLDGEVLVDPQCYARDLDYARLVKYGYWEEFKRQTTSALLSGPGMDAFLNELAALTMPIGIRTHILPGLMATKVTEDWLSFHDTLVERAQPHFGDDQILATVALSSEVTRDENQIEAVVERAASWKVNGFYVVAETPTSYLVDDPNWLANLMILVSGLKLLGKRVVVGYANHQMLCLASAGADVIASGTWLNVRAFQPEKFYAPDPDKQARKTTWYYAPSALSEYKLPTLDLAKRNGVLDLLRAPAALGSTYGDVLFGAAAPTAVAWGEQSAFRHYLTCLRGQAAAARKPTFDETLDAHRRMLDGTAVVLKQVRDAGVYGADRDFHELIDHGKGALITFERARGARLRREWSR